MLRSPFLHFLLLGGLLFGLQQWVPVPLGDELQTIRVSTAELQRLRGEWTRETARAPTKDQLQASINRHVDEEILLREALRLELEVTDPVARERLVMNMRFVFPESRQSDEQLLAEARNLGLHLRDIVVRRRLVQQMEMRIVSQANVSESELREYVTRHPARYARPARYAFRHVFISGDRPSHDAEHEAQALLARLRARGDTSTDAGDPFLLGAAFAPQSTAELDRGFGPGFGKALTQVEPGVWSGPLRSVYGLHLVRVERIEAGAPPDLTQVGTRAAYALLAEREKEVLREELARLRQRYRVELPAVDAPAGITLGMAQ